VRRFISNLSQKVLPFSPLLNVKKDQKIVWGDEQQKAFNEIKEYMKELSYGPPWAHYLGGYQDRLLGGPLGLPDLCCTVPDGVRRKDYGGVVLG
jgi:hypothetical protein